MSLALAIGANTTIFTLINAVFLNPLPVGNLRELGMVSGMDQNNNLGPNLNLTPLSWLNIEDFRKQNDVFSGFSGFIVGPCRKMESVDCAGLDCRFRGGKRSVATSHRIVRRLWFAKIP